MFIDSCTISRLLRFSQVDKPISRLAELISTYFQLRLNTQDYFLEAKPTCTLLFDKRLRLIVHLMNAELMSAASCFNSIHSTHKFSPCLFSESFVTLKVKSLNGVWRVLTLSDSFQPDGPFAVLYHCLYVVQG